MNRKTMTAQEAKAYARSQLREGLEKLRAAEHVFGQLIEQLPFSITLRLERWRVQQHLQPDWSYHSQVGQDKFVHDKFFQSAKDGFFVDVGAHDGVGDNNTLFFERTLGWRGLCFEASPTQFPALVENRRNTCFNIAVGDHTGSATFLDVVGGYTQMSGFVDSIVDLPAVRANPRHQEREIAVPVRPLSEVLDEQDVSSIDYCSIDVEGAEIRVLKGIDFDRHRIAVLSVENAKHWEANPNTEVRSYLEDRGYRYVDTIGYDEIFTLE